MRNFLVIIGACAVGLLAYTGVRDQGGVTVRPVKLSEETETYTYRADVPQVHGLQVPETQMLVNKELAAIVERERRIFVRDAVNVSHAQTGATLKSGLTVTYRVERADERVISMLFVLSPYFFGEENAHHFTVPFNYDLAQRREIALRDVFAGEYLPSLSQAAAEQLTEQSRVAGVSGEDVTRMIVNGSAARTENYDSFSISRDGVVIHFNPASVAPYEQGIRQVAIPGNVMNGYLSENGKRLMNTR